MSDEQAIDTSKLPCCGAASLRARMDKECVDKDMKPFDPETKWHCDECGKPLPEDFMAAVRKENEEFEKGLSVKLKEFSGEDTTVTATVLPKKQPPEPDHPKFKHQKTMVKAFNEGMASGRDPYAMCPYAQDSDMYKHWHRGRAYARRDVDG